MPPDHQLHDWPTVSGRAKSGRHLTEADVQRSIEERLTALTSAVHEPCRSHPRRRTAEKSEEKGQTANKRGVRKDECSFEPLII